MPFFTRSWWPSATSSATTSSSIWQPLGSAAVTTSTTTITTPTVWWSNVGDVTSWDNGTTASATTYYRALTNSLQDQQTAAWMNAQLQAQHVANERYEFRLARIGDHVFTPSRPAIITHQEQMARDRALYERAMAEHNEQEASRLLREIQRVEHLATEERRAVEERAQRHRDEEARRMAARQRARELLLEHLTPSQRDTFEKNGWFIVEGGKSGTRYRIRSSGVAGNIDVLGRGDRVQHRLCCHTMDGTIPQGDNWLAQKIMLELAEEDFVLRANRHAA